MIAGREPPSRRGVTYRVTRTLRTAGTRAIVAGVHVASGLTVRATLPKDPADSAMSQLHTPPAAILVSTCSSSATASPRATIFSDLIGQLAAARGKIFEHRLISAGGASLRRHSERRRSAQGDRQRSVRLRRSPGAEHAAGQAAPNACTRACGCSTRRSRLRAKTVLYMTWSADGTRRSRAAGDHRRAQADGIGRELGATIVPVGAAWESFLRTYDRPALHDKDQSHPGLAGIVSGGVRFLHGIVRGESRSGSESQIAGLEQNDRILLQGAAWDLRAPRPSTGSG